jgi:polysaccharide chain length determinant protein (PEP-CTERM system associated)
MKELFDNILAELRSAWRYRWSALGVAWLVCLLGWFVVLSLPDAYMAGARVFVDTSSRLRDVLGRIAFEPDVQSRVALVRQAMLGRPQLEKVAKAAGLDLRAKTPDDYERLLDELPVKIQINAARDTNLYTISYQDSDRATAIAVVDHVVSTFVEDVISNKQEGSLAAETFLMDQIQGYASSLAEAEQQLADFKRRNVGLMPGESGDYFARLQREQESIDELQASLEIARSKRVELERQQQGLDPILPPGSPSRASAAGPGMLEDPIQLRIRELETQLTDLLLKFTDLHPDVVATRDQLDQLRAQREQEIAALRESGQTDSGLATNPVFQSVRMALNQANVEIAALSGEIAERSRRIAELRALVDTAPGVEAELSRLTRNYGTTRAMYDQLLAQLESERLVNEGDQRDVVTFQVIDPPQASVDPVGPKRVFFLLLVTVLGVGLGGGLAYLLSQLRPVFFDVWSLRAITGRAVLGQVSATWHDREHGARRLANMAYAASLAALVVGFAALIVLIRPSSELVRVGLRALMS